MRVQIASGMPPLSLPITPPGLKFQPRAWGQTRWADGEGERGDALGFIAMLNAWTRLTGVLNELSRSMGLPDFYPFVLSDAVARKLFFVHERVRPCERSGA